MATKYTDDHEWAREDAGVVTVGITDYAQAQLGEIVFVELPEIDQNVEQGEETAVVESVKAAGEVKSPVSGVVVEINEMLDNAPETVNEDPLGEGWFFKLRVTDNSELNTLMDEEAYQGLLDSLD